MLRNMYGAASGLIFCALVPAWDKYSSSTTDSLAPGASSGFMQYNFGKNWNKFMEHILGDDPLSGVGLEERLQRMADHLEEAFGLPSFEGKTFLDVGCGSGLASLAAITYLNASRVISIDYQEGSVQTTKALREMYWARSVAASVPWDVFQGSILDASFVSSLTRADLVYSYGVLMCTGDVWQGLTHVAQLVQPEGLLYFAVHSKEMDVGDDSAKWVQFKREYNVMPKWKQEHAILTYAISELTEDTMKCLAKEGEKVPAEELETGRFERFNVVQRCVTKRFEKFTSGARGMDFVTDAHDWLGGYPYEWLTADSIIQFYKLEVKPAMKVLKVWHEAMAGYLLTPASGGSLWYYFGGAFTGHWWGFKETRILPDMLLSWQEFDELCETYVRDGRCAVEKPSGISCEALAQAHSAEVRRAVRGDRCYVLRLPILKQRNDGLRTEAMVVEDMQILGWGGKSLDGRFCSTDGGGRFRVWDSGLVVFSTTAGDDPRRNDREYHILVRKTRTKQDIV